MSTAVHRFTDTVHALGPKFLERAPAHDRDATFVSENYRELKEHRFFSAAVPAELGGGGLTHPEICHLLRELAHYCPATALALSMHTHLIAATVWRHQHGMAGEALLRKVAATELVLVSTGAGDWIDSVGRAEAVAGGYRVSAVKRFCSGAPAGDLLITSAPFEDGQGGQVLHFPVSMRAQGVSVRDDWDTLGMRATGSHTVELVDVFVPEESVALKRPRGQWHGSWNVVVGVAAPIYMAPYLGAAQQAALHARAALAKRAIDPLELLGLGEVENELTLAELAWQRMVELTNDYDIEPSLALTNRMLICKTLAAGAIVRCVEKALAVVGGSALFRLQGIERLLRDVQGAAFHPLPEKKQLVFTGRVALGLAPISRPERRADAPALAAE
jgi:alkylation response protein AidB-like acyl-CoA dehydrogenase